MLKRLARAWRAFRTPEAVPSSEEDDDGFDFGFTDEDVAPPKPHVYAPTGKDEYGPASLVGLGSPQSVSVRKALEQALEHARQNEVISLFIVSVSDEGRGFQAMAGAANYTLLGFVESAKGDLVEMLR